RGKTRQRSHRFTADEQAHTPRRREANQLHQPAHHAALEVDGCMVTTPAQLGPIAPARNSATAPIGDGGELTQPKKRGWPLPIGCGKTHSANWSRMSSASTPLSGYGCSRSARRSSGRMGVKTDRCLMPAKYAVARSTAR